MTMCRVRAVVLAWTLYLCCAGMRIQREDKGYLFRRHARERQQQLNLIAADEKVNQ